MIRSSFHRLRCRNADQGRASGTWVFHQTADLARQRRPQRSPRGPTPTVDIEAACWLNRFDDHRAALGEGAGHGASSVPRPPTATTACARRPFDRFAPDSGAILSRAKLRRDLSRPTVSPRSPMFRQPMVAPAAPCLEQDDSRSRRSSPSRGRPQQFEPAKPARCPKRRVLSTPPASEISAPGFQRRAFYQAHRPPRWSQRRRGDVRPIDFLEDDDDAAPPGLVASARPASPPPATIATAPVVICRSASRADPRSLAAMKARKGACGESRRPPRAPPLVRRRTLATRER